MSYVLPVSIKKNYFWLCWVFLAVCGLSLVGVSLVAVDRLLFVMASCCKAQALGMRAQKLWCTGLVAPWHVGFSQTSDRTHIPCIGRQILNHWACREVLRFPFFFFNGHYWWDYFY